MGSGIIYDLDGCPISEVTSIESIDTLQDVDSLINTGFIMSSSVGRVEDEKKLIRRTQIFTNEFVNLSFKRV